MTAVAFVVGATVHEAAHAYVAFWLGDRTPKRDGRLSLNPLRHLEVVGLILVLLTGIGWAKPVLTNPSQYRINRKTGMLLVAVAGPLANFLLALALIPFLHAVPFQYNTLLEAVISMNILLATFNLLPVYPLDGEKVLRGLLPMRYLGFFHQMEKYGFYILLLIVMLPPLNHLFVGVPYTVMSQFLFGLGF